MPQQPNLSNELVAEVKLTAIWVPVRPAAIAGFVCFADLSEQPAVVQVIEKV